MHLLCMIAKDVSSIHYYKFYTQYCNSQLFNSLLLLKCSIAIDYLFMPYCNWQPLHVLLQLLALVFTVYNFWIQCCKWQIVCKSGICICFKGYNNCSFILALLLLITFVCTIAISNFCMPYFNSQLIYTPLLLTAFVCAIVNSKSFMCCYNSRQLLYVQLKMLLQHLSQIFIHLYEYWLLYALLQLPNLVCAIVVDNFFPHYYNWQLLQAT